MKRTSDQNELIHCLFRQISVYLTANGNPRSEIAIKETFKGGLGNSFKDPLTGFLGVMPTSSYVRADEDLTQAQIDKGVLSMDGFINEIVAYCATEFNLQLELAEDKGDG